MLTVTQVIELLKAEAEKAGTQKALAKAMGVSASFLSDIILGKRDPTGKVLDYLGLVKSHAYLEITVERHIPVTLEQQASLLRDLEIQ